jgi:hypothetical protein
MELTKIYIPFSCATVGHKPSLRDIQATVQSTTLTNTKSTSKKITSENQAQQDENINMHVRKTV